MTAVLGLKVTGVELFKGLFEAVDALSRKKNAGGAWYNGFQKTAFFKSNDRFAASHGLDGGQAKIFMLRTNESLAVLIKRQEFFGRNLTKEGDIVGVELFFEFLEEWLVATDADNDEGQIKPMTGVNG